MRRKFEMIIGTCYDCPFLFIKNIIHIDKFVCQHPEHKHRKIISPDVIPEFCPLPVLKE
jgi:hypothetical protein